MRVAAYLRVSTDTQAEHGLGLDVQRQAIRAWARQHGHKIASWHSDEGISGSNGLDTRDALPDAVAEVRDGRAAGIVVYRLDRLAHDLILQETLLAEIAGLGGRVYSTFAGEQEVVEDDPDDPSRRLIRQVLGAVSEYERSLIRLRLRNGRRRKAERGGYAARAGRARRAVPGRTMPGRYAARAAYPQLSGLSDGLGALFGSLSGLFKLGSGLLSQHGGAAAAGAPGPSMQRRSHAPRIRA